MPTPMHDALMLPILRLCAEKVWVMISVSTDRNASG